MASGQYRLLKWTVDLTPTGSVVTLSGELDLSVAESLRLALDGVVLDGEVLFDVRELTFIDSTGLRFLIDVKRAVEDERAGRFVLRDPSDAVSRVLEVTGMQSFFADPAGVQEKLAG